MAYGLHKFTVQEAQNIQLGQCTSAFLDDTDIYNCSGATRVVAIQIIQDAKFEALTEEDGASCVGSTEGSNEGGSGDAVPNTTAFVAGLTLYGRWTNVDLASGVVILYIAS